MHSFVTEIIYH